MTDTWPHPDTTGFIHSGAASADHIRHVLSRFTQANDGRLARCRDDLKPKQQQAFDLLPLLFHLSHQSLPGYSGDPHCPTGIAQYQPAKSLLKAAQRLTGGLMSQGPALHKAAISGLYLIGTGGSIGQAIGTELMIWVCFETPLSARQLALLREKTDQLTQWAQGFHLMLRFVLVDARHWQVSSHPSSAVGGPRSGSDGRRLDEFYQTAQVLAGVYPAWWLVPTAYEGDYAATLQALYHTGAVDKSQCIDFGGLGALASDDFAGAGLRQIHQAIDSPYQSVLMLILLEIYARQLPHIDCLAQAYKNRIYRMQLSLDDLDPYVMLYQKIESYLLAHDQTKRLELIRRCFYFKVGLKLSQRTHALGWRHKLMDNLVQSWGWSAAALKHLDAVRAWTIEDMLTERRLLIAELTQSYRALCQYSPSQPPSDGLSRADRLSLNRKLHAAFDRRQGKINFIHIGLDVDLSNQRVHLYERASREDPGVYQWGVYDRPMSQQSRTPALKSANGLVEALLWCHLNGLLTAALQVPIFPARHEVNDDEVRTALTALRNQVPNPRPHTEAHCFDRPARVTRVLLIINLGCDPRQSRSDSSVHSLDQVLVNSWGEVEVERFATQDALAKGLKSLLNRIHAQAPDDLPELVTLCPSQVEHSVLALRVDALMQAALAALCSIGQPPNNRFICRIGNRYLLYQAHNRTIGYVPTDSLDELRMQLALEQADYSRLIFDRQFALDHPLWAKLYRLHRPHAVLLACEKRHQQATLYLIDEQGSLLVFKQPVRNLATLWAPLLQFLHATDQRRSGIDDRKPKADNHFVQIERSPGRFDLKKTGLNDWAQAAHFIGIGVTVTLSAQGGYDYRVVCGEQEFHSPAWGDLFYRAIASYGLGLDPSRANPEIYIIDLALTSAVIDHLPLGRDQTMHYLQFKLKLERRIHAAQADL
ncbi:class I adenylate cyclase [Reinekea sp.]|uniref:class I adenylate cyclase n=1 Tax=Reinekea sp. TaxID=1970455 RepID=UPI00257E0B3C|nr:class I adenylate cyclase [Reinekea sp.]